VPRKLAGSLRRQDCVRARDPVRYPKMDDEDGRNHGLLAVVAMARRTVAASVAAADEVCGRMQLVQARGSGGVAALSVGGSTAMTGSGGRHSVLPVPFAKAGPSRCASSRGGLQ
jgi:hypothetical protein